MWGRLSLVENIWNYVNSILCTKKTEEKWFVGFCMYGSI